MGTDLGRFRAIHPCAAVAAALRTVEANIFPNGIRWATFAPTTTTRIRAVNALVRAYPEQLPTLQQRFRRSRHEPLQNSTLVLSMRTLSSGEETTAEHDRPSASG